MESIDAFTSLFLTAMQTKWTKPSPSLIEPRSTHHQRQITTKLVHHLKRYSFKNVFYYSHTYCVSVRVGEVRSVSEENQN